MADLTLPPGAVSVPLTGGVPSHADLNALASAFWAKQAVEQPDAPPTELSTGIAVVSSLSQSLVDCLDTDIVRPLVWPDKLPYNHPLRSHQTFVKLWGSEAHKEFWDALRTARAKGKQEEEAGVTKDDRTDPFNETSWIALKNSFCEEDGTPIFKETPDELKTKYSGNKHTLWVVPLWEQSMRFNGVLSDPVEATEAKNSVTTATSASSGVSSSKEDAPGEKQPPLTSPSTESPVS